MAREKSQAAHRIRSSFADTISAKSFINKNKAFKQTGLWPTQERSKKKKKIAAAELPLRQRLSSGTTLRIGAKQLLINPLTSEEDCVRQQASRDPADGNRTTGLLILSADAVWHFNNCCESLGEGRCVRVLVRVCVQGGEPKLCTPAA